MKGLSPILEKHRALGCWQFAWFLTRDESIPRTPRQPRWHVWNAYSLRDGAALQRLSLRIIQARRPQIVSAVMRCFRLAATPTGSMLSRTPTKINAHSTQEKVSGKCRTGSIFQCFMQKRQLL
jgi:hypothetical protein